MRLVIKTDENRLSDLITVDEYIGFESRDFKSMINVTCKCLYNEEKQEYYPFEEARKIVGSLTVNQLRELIGTVQKEINDAVASPKLEPELG